MRRGAPPVPEGRHSSGEARAAFDDLRECLDALDAERDGTGSHREGDPALAEMDRLLAPALAIAGEEGAGKSTLVNAILGVPLVPTDANSPGTVAPIRIDVAAAAPLSYAVRLHGDAGSIACADRRAFARYLLQRENPDNAKGVRRGVIRTAGPDWADGVRLIDLPGTEGLSDAVQREVAAALREVESAVLVINDRNAAPGFWVAARLKAFGRDADAVIVNLRSTKLLDDETRRPLPDAAVDENIAMIRAFVCGEIARLGFAIPAARVFAIYLPALRALELNPDAAMNAPAHLAETARFAAWFRAGFCRAGAGVRLARVLDIASARLESHVCVARAEKVLVDGLRRGAQAAIGQAGALLEERRRLLPGRWREALAQAGEAAAAERASRQIEAALQDLKTSLVALHQTCRASLPEEKLAWFSADRTRIAARLNKGAADAAGEFERRRETALQAYLDVCGKAAEAVVADDDDALAPVRIPVGRAKSSSARLWRKPRFEIETGGLLGFEWLWTAASIDRMLHESRHAEMAVDAVAIGAAFRSQLEGCRAAHCASLRQRLDALGALIAEPDHGALVEAERALKKRAELFAQARAARAECRRTLKRLDQRSSMETGAVAPRANRRDLKARRAND